MKSSQCHEFLKTVKYISADVDDQQKLDWDQQWTVNWWISQPTAFKNSYCNCLQIYHTLDSSLMIDSCVTKLYRKCQNLLCDDRIMDIMANSNETDGEQLYVPTDDPVLCSSILEEIGDIQYKQYFCLEIDSYQQLLTCASDLSRTQSTSTKAPMIPVIINYGTSSPTNAEPLNPSSTTPLVNSETSAQESMPSNEENTDLSINTTLPVEVAEDTDTEDTDDKMYESYDEEGYEHYLQEAEQSERSETTTVPSSTQQISTSAINPPSIAHYIIISFIIVIICLLFICYMKRRTADNDSKGYDRQKSFDTENESQYSVNEDDSFMSKSKNKKNMINNDSSEDGGQTDGNSITDTGNNSDSNILDAHSSPKLNKKHKKQKRSKTKQCKKHHRTRNDDKISDDDDGMDAGFDIHHSSESSDSSSDGVNILHNHHRHKLSVSKIKNKMISKIHSYLPKDRRGVTSSKRSKPFIMVDADDTSSDDELELALVTNKLQNRPPINDNEYYDDSPTEIYANKFGISIHSRMPLPFVESGGKKRKKSKHKNKRNDISDDIDMDAVAKEFEKQLDCENSRSMVNKKSRKKMKNVDKKVLTVTSNELNIRIDNEMSIDGDGDRGQSQSHAYAMSMMIDNDHNISPLALESALVMGETKSVVDESVDGVNGVCEEKVDGEVEVKVVGDKGSELGNGNEGNNSLSSDETQKEDGSL